MTEPREQTFSDFKSEMENLFSLKLEEFGQSAERMSSYALVINNTFIQGRQRMVELMTEVANSVPNITRLGGSIENVADTIISISQASKRNVIANTESVEKMFAASTILKQDVETLAKSFLDVGIGIENIPKNLEDSMEYIRSIGGNTKEIMQDVTNNMEQMNRFQFENGVKGLTKMAAQASMLRFDMNQTFQLADKVLSPEGAIEVASAFQRLGVAAGNLVDPFQLMNQSINDPSGLQDSLVNVAKQFTYFDEKTKSFKINPQGVLTLKEVQQQTGVSAAELSKMGLAAAELDKRLSAVSGAGLKIASEEDKQYLANIARMGEGGEYEVTVTNKEGREETKKLTQVTQDEFDKLIKQQKDGPKTLEDLARSQLNVTQTVTSDVKAIKDKLLFGIVSSPRITGAVETGRSIATSVTGELSKVGSTSDVRGRTESIFDAFSKLGKDLANPNKTLVETLKENLTEFGNQFDDIKKSLGGGVVKALQKVADQNAKGNDTQRKFAEYLNNLIQGKSTSVIGKSISSVVQEAKIDQKPEIGNLYQGLDFSKFTAKDLSISSVIQEAKSDQKPEIGNLYQGLDFSKFTVKDLSMMYGEQNMSQIIEKIKSENLPQQFKTNTPNQPVTSQKTEVAFGDINVKISLSDNYNQLNMEQQKKFLTDVFNSQDFQQMILNLVSPKSPYKPQQ
jgi:hypothetical protein